MADPRRLTRTLTERNAGVSVMDVLVDAYNLLFAVLLAALMLQPALQAAGAAPARQWAAALDPFWLALSGAAATVGLTLAVLDRIGPLHLAPAPARWWLPTLAERDTLLRPVLWRVVAAGGAVGAVGGMLPALALNQAMWVGAGAAVASAASVGLAVHQPSGAVGRRLDLFALGLAAVPLTWGLTGARAPEIPASVGVGAIAVCAAAAAALLPAALRVPRSLHDRDIRRSGAQLVALQTSVLRLDARNIGAVMQRPGPSGRRSRWSLGRVRGPRRALAAADLLLLRREPRRLGQLLVGPVSVGVVGALPGAPTWLIGVAVLAGGYFSAASTAGGVRAAQEVALLRQALPLSARQTRVVQLWPAIVLMIASGAAMGALASASAAQVGLYALLGATAGPVWVAAAFRGVTRPQTELSGAVVPTPMGAFPADAAQVFGHGLDLAVLGLIPFGWALWTATVTVPTLLAQTVASLTALAFSIYAAGRR